MKDNKLIAEFMGHPTMIWNDPDPIEGNDYRVVYFKQLCNETALIQYGVGEYNSEAQVLLDELEGIELKYHTSWDWLMPVVVKCFDVFDQKNDDLNFKLNDALLETNIDSLYKAVVEFIKEYKSTIK